MANIDTKKLAKFLVVFALTISTGIAGLIGIPYTSVMMGVSWIAPSPTNMLFILLTFLSLGVTVPLNIVVVRHFMSPYFNFFTWLEQKFPLPEAKKRKLLNKEPQPSDWR